MSNVSLDASGFSEQLGIYDFFNVLVYGSIFICGISAINSKISQNLWSNPSFFKGIGIALLIYIIGMILQELGSHIDEKGTKLYKKMHRSILKGKVNTNYTEETTNKIIENPIVLKRYRQLAKKLLKQSTDKNDDVFFENEYINGYMFTVCQYYVAVKNKDKKTERLRAIFSMSKTLMCCFGLLSAISVLSVFCPVGTIIKFDDLIGVSFSGCADCSSKIIFFLVFAGLAFVFKFRAKRTMRNFLLILLGTYDALMRSEENENKHQEIKVIPRKIRIKKDIKCEKV